MWYLGTKIGLFAILYVLSFGSVAENVSYDFEQWQLKYDCEKNAFESFHYITLAGIDNKVRSSEMQDDVALPDDCGTKNKRSYRVDADNGTTYIRGRAMRIKNLDNNVLVQKANLAQVPFVPMAKQMYRTGHWNSTEKIISCWKNLGKVEVWGGVIWPKQSIMEISVTSIQSNRPLVEHIAVPDRIWKMIKFPNGEVNAWIFPNSDKNISADLNQYLVGPHHITDITGIDYKIDNAQVLQQDINTKKMHESCMKDKSMMAHYTYMD